MVTKPSDLLQRLPSVNELLEKPQIRALADRWNRSVVAAGVRSFLEELRSDMERRAADFHLPSLRDIAERAARHVAAQQQSTARSAVNATGRCFGPDWRGLPLADEALERLISVSRGYVFDTSGERSGDAATRLRRLTGAESATIVSSYSGAVWLALTAIAHDRQAIVARGDLGELADGSSLSAIARSAGVELREVGAVNRTTAHDFEAALTDRTGVLLRHTADGYRLEGDTKLVDADALLGLARKRELPVVELLGSAPLTANLPMLAAAPISATARIAAGAQLVILRGDGLVGGPRCGILIGTRRLIDTLESHPLFTAWRADSMALAALEATLALYDDPARLTLSVPTFQLLATSIENLRQRAERLAPQLSEADDVEAAIAVECDSCFGLAGIMGNKSPSYAIALTPTGKNVAALDERLRKSPVPIVGRREGDRLLLDLRTVLPRQDQSLVEMVVRRATSVTESASETAAPATV